MRGWCGVTRDSSRAKRAQGARADMFGETEPAATKPKSRACSNPSHQCCCSQFLPALAGKFYSLLNYSKSS